MTGAGVSKEDWDVMGLYRRAMESLGDNDKARVALAQMLVRSVQDPDAAPAVRECIMTLQEKANDLQQSAAYRARKEAV